MTEREIIAILCAAAESAEKGTKADLGAVGESLRQAISMLYNVGFEHGYKRAEAHGTASLEGQKKRKASLEREIERLQYELEDMTERAQRAERAADMIRLAIADMGRALAAAESSLD